MSRLAIPPGGGLTDAVELIIQNRLGEKWKEARVWVAEAIVAVRTAKDSPFKDADDETIATEIMKNIDRRRIP